MISKNMSYNTEFLTRYFEMLDAASQEKILNSSVLLFGVGGVGSAVAEFLVRSGIHHLTIVDFDTIDITNINRQLVSNSENIGKLKVDEMANKLLEINPNVQIRKYPIKISEETASQIDFSSYDCIIDCIDDIKAKQLIIKTAKSYDKYVICAMGAGNRYAEIPQFEISDIHKTSYDPLAKVIRKFCVKEGIKKLEVCYTKQKAMKFNCNFVASVVYYPVNMATIICARVMNKIIEE